MQQSYKWRIRSGGQFLPLISFHNGLLYRWQCCYYDVVGPPHPIQYFWWLPYIVSCCFGTRNFTSHTPTHAHHACVIHDATDRFIVCPIRCSQFACPKYFKCWIVNGFSQNTHKLLPLLCVCVCRMVLRFSLAYRSSSRSSRSAAAIGLRSCVLYSGRKITTIPPKIHQAVNNDMSRCSSIFT